MSKHTKGPWSFEKADENTTFYLNPMNYEVCVGGARSEGETFTEEELANMTLMTAASDMLAALEELLFAMTMHGYPAEAVAVEKARAAIKKATGE